jgi:hypothetical protein
MIATTTEIDPLAESLGGLADVLRAVAEQAAAGRMRPGVRRGIELELPRLAVRIRAMGALANVEMGPDAPHSVRVAGAGATNHREPASSSIPPRN